MLASLSDKAAVFSSPTHDFPQRVIYRLQRDGAVHARIEGMQDGTERAIDYPMRPVPCE